ncbi:hypothetical protein GCM10011584_33880 [Nocardioides phosphati]|uniref:Acetoacetate decarboxylase n=1 Tax=Nocardioides phosphati TaxID=1867775 RepID=A0ABQ2NDM0_9ACTN|nr:acetoacetate decarboxylase family protein [Nocardioides phosphati]GGO93961.1 hypothetical protein GCM10011584_33880 [Nocardioides phosphati]
MSGRVELTDVAGVPETRLLEAVASRLPPNASTAPWECRCEALVWAARGSRAAREALPPALAGSRALAVVGGFVRYADTPVGRYDEVLGLVASHRGLRPWGSVAFMAVDSEPSLVGGRSNWAMPKTLAAFEGEIASGATITGGGAGDLSWRVSAKPRVVGPPLPLRASVMARQQFPDGVVRASRLRNRGWFRPALVRVEVESDGPLPSWLRPGWHLGAVVDRMTFTLGAPRGEDG